MAKARSESQTQASFSPALFKFLVELKAHNDRAWFQEHKDRYEADVKGPLLAFIADLAPRLHKLSPHFKADPRPVGGSMFRIYRDTRFSKDKSPYKTHAAAHFPHMACEEGVHGPGFYLHLEPGESFVGGGLWHPEPDGLRKVREAILKQGKAWKAIKELGFEIEGDTLQRVPQGFPADHPFAEDLKRKDFYIGTAFTDRQVCSPDFPEIVAEAMRQASPLVKFITKAMELAW